MRNFKGNFTFLLRSGNNLSFLFMCRRLKLLFSLRNRTQSTAMQRVFSGKKVLKTLSDMQQVDRPEWRMHFVVRRNLYWVCVVGESIERQQASLKNPPPGCCVSVQCVCMSVHHCAEYYHAFDAGRERWESVEKFGHAILRRLSSYYYNSTSTSQLIVVQQQLLSLPMHYYALAKSALQEWHTN